MSALEEDWSSGRKEKDILEEKSAQERAKEGLQGVNALLKKFSEDEYFKDDLKQPTVIMALKHWTGENRLPPEQATRLFAEDYRCRAVLEKLRVLQAECQKAGIPVPLDHLIRGEKELNLPGEKKKKASPGAKAAPATAKKPSPTAASSKEATSDAKPTRRRTASKTTSRAGDSAKAETQTVPAPPNPLSMLFSIFVILLGVALALYMRSA